MTQPSNIPVPDPSFLTTEQLHRELKNLRELVDARLTAMDKAAVLLESNVTRVPTEIDKQIAHLTGLVNEKFSSVEKQFSERDVRASASESASNTAVNAALQAQKEAAAAQNQANSEAIAKSEKTTEKQFDGINALLKTTTDSLNDKISSLSSRLDRGEGASTGIAGKQASGITIASLCVAVAAVLFAIYHAASLTPQPQILVAPPTSISAPK